MSEELVTLQLGRVFRTFEHDINTLADDILLEGAQVLRREYVTSVTSGSSRFFRTGAGLQSTAEELAGGARRSYRLVPTAFYMIFGEYGTGRRGSETGRPAPVGYRYGQSKGMAARRFGRTAVGRARPQIESLSKERVARFAANMTT